MADEEDLEEFLNNEEPEPDNPVTPVGSENVTSHEISQTATERSKTASITLTNASDVRQTSATISQSTKKDVETLEETSKSDRSIIRSQEISRTSKQSSLDQLPRKVSVQKPKVAKCYRQCNRQFREIIGKREMRNEELEKEQGDLQERLNILECSMPAVMVWNVWRMTKGTGVPSLKKILEKQFQGPAAGEEYCPSTPSRHFDCRVREAEAERKLAYKRTEEARTLWSEKMAVLQEKEKRVQEARKLQEEQRKRIEQLTSEAQKLRDARKAAEEDGSCEAGECGVIECKKKWLEKVPSSGSIKSTDIECLEKLQELAEAELNMKRQITDLERREEAYMRTLQQADQLWAKLDEDAASTMSGLQDQLETKTAANQQMANRICQLEDELEKLGSRLVTCRNELEKYLSKGKIEALIGRDDDFATVSDSAAVAGVRKKDTTTPTQSDMVDEIEALKSKLATCRDELEKYLSIGKIEALIGRDDDFATVSDSAAVAGVRKKDTTTTIQSDMVDEMEALKSKLATCRDELENYLSIGKIEALIGKDDDFATVSETAAIADVPMKDTGLGIRPEDFARDEAEMEEVKKLLAQLGSLSELDGPGEFCFPEFDCNDLQLSATGLTEEEKLALEENRVTARELLEKCGLLEIAEQMTDEPMQYRVVAKSVASESLAATSTRDTLSSRIVMEEDLREEEFEREILYDDIEPEKIEDDAKLSDKKMVKESSMVLKEMDNASVPLTQLSNWQNMVQSIGSKVATCTNCSILKEDARILAEELAAYTGKKTKFEVEEEVFVEVKVDVKEKLVEREVEMKFVSEKTVEQIFDEVEKAEKVRQIAPEVEFEPHDAEKEVEESQTVIPEPKGSGIEARPLREVVEEIVEETMVRAPSTPLSKDTVEVVEEVKPEVDDKAIESPMEIADHVRKISEIEEKKAEMKEEKLPSDIDTRMQKETDADLEKKQIEPDVVEVKEETIEKQLKEESKEDEREEIDEEKKLKADVGEQVKQQVEKKEETEEVKGKEELRYEEAEVKKEEISVDKKAASVKEEIAEVEDRKVDEILVERVTEVRKEEDTSLLEEVAELEDEEILLEQKDIKVDILTEEEIVKIKEEVISEEEIEEITEVKKEVISEEKIEEITEVKEEVLPEEEEEIVPEKEEFEIDIVPIEEIEKPEEILPEEEEIKIKEEEIKPEEDEISEFDAEVPPEEEEIEVALIPVEDTTKPVEEIIPLPEEVIVVVIPLEEADAEEEIEVEVLELERIELEVEVLEEVQVTQFEVEIEIEKFEVPDEVTEEEEKPTPKEEIEISMDEECICDEIPRIEAPLKPEELFPSVAEEIPDSIKEEQLTPICTCISEPVKKMKQEEMEKLKYPPIKKEHLKMEVTQTETTQMETTMGTIQAITQTVADVGLQTQPSPKLLRHPQQPRIVTKTIDPDPEILERLARWKKSQQPSTTTTTTVTSQTEKSSFLRILQSLRSSGAYSKLDPEKELKSIHYQKTKKPVEVEARCNCCLCGTIVPDTIPCEKPLGTQTSSVMRLLQALPLLGKAAPGVDQAVQHESLCPECKLKKLGFQPKVTQTTRDQEVNVCGAKIKRSPVAKPKKKSDESCMARIRVEKLVQRELVVEKMSLTKSVQETTVATSVKDPEDNVEDQNEQEEYKDSVDCMCSLMGSETDGKKVRCGCGDPD